MRTSVFKIIFVTVLFSGNFFVRAEAANTIDIYNINARQIGQGLQLSASLVVASSRILTSTGFYLRKNNKDYSAYDVAYVDPIARLVFLKVSIPFTKDTFKYETKVKETESVYKEVDGKFIDIGFFTTYIKGYGAIISDNHELYEGMPLYDKNGAVLGLLMNRYTDNMFLYLNVEWLHFYRDNFEFLVKAKRPVLHIIVNELWEQPGIRVMTSKNPFFKEGDTIIRVNDSVIRNVLDFNRALIAFSMFDQMTFTILRNGNTITFDITLRRDTK